MWPVRSFAAPRQRLMWDLCVAGQAHGGGVFQRGLVHQKLGGRGRPPVGDPRGRLQHEVCWLASSLIELLVGPNSEALLCTTTSGVMLSVCVLFSILSIE